MKTFLLFFIFFIQITAIGQLHDKEIHDLKRGRVKDDTSYVYWLPYEAGKKYLFIQGANSKFSHKEELAFDFKMKAGSKICAVRGGIVVAIKFDSDQGGLNDKYLNDGNHIIVKHDDGSTALYWHLKHEGVLVKLNEVVQKGQVIGYSGNTGYTAFPHLHFQVIDNNGKEILPRFITKKGVLYLRPGRLYKAVKY